MLLIMQNLATENLRIITIRKYYSDLKNGYVEASARQLNVASYSYTNKKHDKHNEVL